MSSKIITKSIYELSKIESKIVNKAIKTLTMIMPIRMCIKSVKVEFVYHNYCRLINEYLDVDISNVLVDSDIGTFKLDIWNHYDTFNNKRIKENGDEIARHGYEPILEFYHISYSISDIQEYIFTIKWKKNKVCIKNKIKHWINKLYQLIVE